MGVDGSERNAEVQWGKEREGGRGRQTKRKEKEKEGKFSRPREGITG